jgi:hypothetical protein
MPKSSPIDPVTTLPELDAILNAEEVDVNHEVVGLVGIDDGKFSNDLLTEINLRARHLNRLRTVAVPAGATAADRDKAASEEDKNDVRARFKAFIIPELKASEAVFRAEVFVNKLPQEIVLLRAADPLTDDAVPAVPPGTPDVLSWETASHPERKPWTQKLIALVADHFAQLEQGNGEAFVGGYNGLSAGMKIKFWAELIVAMAKFESSWNPKCVFLEPPPLGVNSIGLLQLSRQDGNNYHLSPPIQSENELKEPLLNLTWGVAILAKLLDKDKTVASGHNGATAKGGARYWSVLRAGHKIEDIKALTKKNTGL